MCEMLLHTLGLALKRKGAGQMIKGILANQVDQILGRIERGRVRRGVQEGQVDVFQSCPGGVFGDDSQQFADGRLHRVPVDGGIVEDHGNPVVSQLGIAQYQQEDYHNRVPGFAFLTEIDMGCAPLQVNAEEAVQPCAVPLVARHGRRGVLRRPGVVGVRDGLEGEFIQRHEDAIRRKFGCFFLSPPRRRRALPGWLAHNPGAHAGARGRVGGKFGECAQRPTGCPTSGQLDFAPACLSTGNCPGHNLPASCAAGYSGGLCAAGATMPAERPAARGRGGHRNRHGGKGRTNAPRNAGGLFGLGTHRPWSARPRWPSGPKAAAVGGGSSYVGNRVSAITPCLGEPNVGCGFFGS